MRVLVTGAVEGLGRAMTEQLITDGHEVVAIDHNKSGLHELTQSNIRHCEGTLLDLADLDAVGLYAASAQRESLDMVVLSAGISATGPFEDIDSSAHQKVIDINLKSALALVSGLKKSSSLASPCRIVIIASLSNSVGYPGASVYAATKVALESYANSIAKAWKRDGVRVLTVFPGPLKTAHASRYAPEDADEAKRMEPAKAAKLILKAAAGRQKTLYPGMAAQAFATFGKLAPRFSTRLMKRIIYDKLDKPRV